MYFTLIGYCCVNKYNKICCPKKYCFSDFFFFRSHILKDFISQRNVSQAKVQILNKYTITVYSKQIFFKLITII